MRGTEAKLQTLILQKHTHQQEDAEHHLLSDKTYSTPNEQNSNSHLLSLPNTKTSTKLHNSVTKKIKIFLVFLSRFSPPLSRSPRAHSLSLSLSLSFPPSLPAGSSKPNSLSVWFVRVLASVGRLSEREKGGRPRTITGGSGVVLKLPLLFTVRLWVRTSKPSVWQVLRFGL